MNNDYIVPIYVIIDDILRLMNYEDDVCATVSGAEVLMVTVVAARFFQNHHKRALCILHCLGDIPRLSVSRFNRRLHALQEVLGQLSQAKFILSTPCRCRCASTCMLSAVRKCKVRLSGAIVLPKRSYFSAGSCIWCVMPKVLQSLSMSCLRVAMNSPSFKTYWRRCLLVGRSRSARLHQRP